MPWYGLREGPRAGTTGTPLGIKTGRMHDLPTKAHRTYFFLREREPGVVDIRERFPILSIRETLELCAEMGVRHPRSNVRGTPEPFVIDFLVTKASGGKALFEARDLLRADDRTLRVKQAWCARHGVPWMAVNAERLTDDLLDSLVFCRGWFRHLYEPNDSDINRFVNKFRRTHKRTLTLGQILHRLAMEPLKSAALINNEFRYAVWSGALKVDLTIPLGLQRPVMLT